jgi:hypothetical protein
MALANAYHENFEGIFSRSFLFTKLVATTRNTRAKRTDEDNY